MARFQPPRAMRWRFALSLAACLGAAGLEAQQNTDLDTPEASSAVLQALTNARMGQRFMTVVEPTSAGNRRWVRGLEQHETWPVRRPFAVLMQFDCNSAGQAADPECWSPLALDAEDQ